MSLARTTAIFRLAALLPVLVAAVLPGSVNVLVCRSGAVMDVETCCAPDADPAGGESSPTASLRDEACCTLKVIELAKVVSDRDSDLPAATFVGVPVVALLDGPRVVQARSTRAVRPPSLGPPILLLKQSFLI